MLSACSALPTQVDRPLSAAQQPSAGSPLVQIAQDSSPAPTLTGFRLLPDGFYFSKLQSSYRLRFAPDGQSLEWLAVDDQGDVVFSEEPEVTPFMRLQIMLLAPFVPEQLL